MLDLFTMPGFIYKERWVIEKLRSSKLDSHEAKQILGYLRRKGIITYERDLKGYRLT